MLCRGLPTVSDLACPVFVRSPCLKACLHLEIFQNSYSGLTLPCGRSYSGIVSVVNFQVATIPDTGLVFARLLLPLRGATCVERTPAACLHWGAGCYAIDGA